MKNNIKRFYNIIRRLPIMIIIMIMILSVVGTMIASNFIVGATKYSYAQMRISSIEDKAERGRVISLKHGYMEHWNDDLRSQYKKANEAFEDVLAYSDAAKWINKTCRTDMGSIFVLLTVVFSITVIYNSVFAVYASFLALAKKACEHEDKKIEQYRNRHRTVRIIRG